jgi:ABC-type transport system involved in multi-copper enzyme maturation permease subunit
MTAHATLDAPRALLTSEWTKLRSVRSTYWTLAVAALAAVGTAILICNAVSSYWFKLDPGQQAAFDPVSECFDGFIIGQLAIGALGVLAISAEHTTGIIRTTFAAVPHRRAVLAAKAVVLAVLATVVGEAIAFASFFAGQLLLRPTHVEVGLGDPGVLGAVSAAGLYLPVVAMVGLGVGALIRHTAGALSALFGLLFLLPQIVYTLPSPWDTRIGSYMMTDAAKQMASLRADPDLLSPTWSAVVLAGYAVVALGVATWLITRRDA